jgi:alpha-1,6-mannosyltransferase
MKWIYFPFFDHHIANSEYTAAELRQASDGHAVPRGTWIRPMGVELGHLSPGLRSPEMRQRLLRDFGAGFDANAVLLLYVGRLVPEKNLPLLFDGMERLCQDSQRDFRLLVVGDGMERARWEQECGRKLPGRVRFAGHIGDPGVLAGLYANADLFVHPNPREPFGIAPLEAMASGLPLVVPNRGGVTAYANEQNAWTADANVDGFCAAILAAVENDSLRRQKMERALETARQYGWDRVAASFFELYEELHESMQGSAAQLAPAFSSSPASRLQKLLIDSVSKSAGSIFSLLSR